MSNFEHIYFETQNLLVRQYTTSDIDGLDEVTTSYNINIILLIGILGEKKHLPKQRKRISPYF